MITIVGIGSQVADRGADLSTQVGELLVVYVEYTHDDDLVRSRNLR